MNKNIKGRRSLNKIRNSRKIARLFRLFIVISILLLVIISCINIVYNNFYNDKNTVEYDSTENERLQNININIAVLGVDEDETRTDSISVIHFDSEIKKLSMLSIPRDTKVYIAPKVKKIYEDNNYYYREPTKINSIHSYGGKYASECIVLQLEDFLGVDINHYIKFNMKAVEKFVDAFGGVDFYVPQDINLGDNVINKGIQHIDGKEAVNILRFRSGYDNQDIGRIKTQQDFIKALFEKITNTDEIMKNLPNILKTILKYVKTDITIGDITEYYKYLDDIKNSEIIMETISGVSEKEEGISYYIPYENSKEEVINKIFHNIMPDTEKYDENTEQIEYGEGIRSDYKIQALNFGYIYDLKKQNVISKLSYNVSNISTYDE